MDIAGRKPFNCLRLAGVIRFCHGSLALPEGFVIFILTLVRGKAGGELNFLSLMFAIVGFSSLGCDLEISAANSI